MSIKHVPSSKVPIYGYIPDSIKTYQEKIICSDELSVEEDDADPLRDIGIESSQLDQLDDQLLDQVELWQKELEHDDPGLEVYDKVKSLAMEVGDQVVKLFDSVETRANKLAFKAHAMDESLKHYTPVTEPLVLKTAKGVASKQSIRTSDIEKALANNIRLASFVKDRYKPLIQGYVDKIIAQTEQHFKSDFSDRVLNKTNYKAAVTEISNKISADVSNQLSNYFIGPSDTRMLVGGWELKRVDEWKKTLIEIGSFLRFTRWPSINLARIITFNHVSYTGNSALSTGPSAQELSRLLSAAAELAKLTIVDLKDVSFTVSEYQDVLRNIHSVTDNFSAEASFAKDIADWMRRSSGEAAINGQVKAAAALPARIVKHNLQAVEAILRYCNEIIEISKQSTNAQD